MKHSHLATKEKGFTLVELMIGVLIVGILAAIAMPSYQSQMRESRRNDGQSALMQLKMQQEAYRLENNSYAATANLALPASDYYTFTAGDVTATTYTLTATAKGSQTDDTGCTTLTLDQSMNRTPAQCWR
ncbi:prepilin-type N-terminal cleavage/methylation domain-containing protein [Alteromonas aestuariivivens]|uniref:Prepilin-type N-terminal cleavage/methylation domain-containing protein n=1 Tax=Alteromonas aestuariivivens TaxID=1938339 RepID=A0A3D8MEL8_9ALTE|nr:type IV pilin protein [Alteromonas aestuariivivens]RDV29319.1 prepilin-type N-terminal cleavage/methylation domain-containing protein [Alteromonas aestuariivivens]